MFRLKTLGGVLIEGPGGPLTGAASQRRRLAVLTLLAAHGNGISRDRLIGLLWPENDEERARHALAQLLYSLRRELGEVAVTGSATVLRLDASIVASDVQEFLQALEKHDDQRAVDLYGGPFLDGFYLTGCPEFERWVEEERARLAQLARAAIERMATHAEQTGDRARAILQWRRLVSLDPYDARCTLALLRALVAAGDRTGALRQAKVYEELLRDQLNTTPDPEITAYATALAAVREDAPSAEVAARVETDPASVAVGTEDADVPPGIDGEANTSASADVGSAAVARSDRRRARPRRTVVAGGVVVGAVLLAWLGIALPGRSAEDGPPAWVLLTDVENETGDVMVDRTVPFALAAGLRQSRTLYVVPPDRIRVTLARMRRVPAADSALDETLAREIARRDGIRFVIIPSAQRSGEGYSLSARIIEPATGTALRVVSVQATGGDDIIGGLDRLSRRIRRATGESALRVATRSTPLPQVTTASIAALEKYASGSRAFVRGLWREAEMLMLEAIAIDSTFAAAHADLGVHAYWTNRATEGEARFARALAHLDGLPDRERTLIRSRIESWRSNRLASIDLLNTLLIEQPNDLEALQMLGYDYLRLGRDREGTDVFRRVVRLDSMDHTAWINLATVEKGVGEFESAIEHYRRAFRLLPSLQTENSNINHEFGSTWVLAGMPDSAAAVFSLMLPGSRPGRARGLRSLAFLAMYRGHYAEASGLLAEAVRLTNIERASTGEIRNRVLLATSLEQRGLTAAARAQRDSAYLLATRGDTDPILVYWLGKALSRDGDVHRPTSLLDALDARRHPDNVSARAASEALRGEILVARGEGTAALPHFEVALRDDSSKITLESLAHAVHKAGDLGRAARLYEELAREPAFGHESQEPYRTALYRLAVIAEERGDAALALRALQQFMENWRDAEPALPILLDARDRLNRLSAVMR